MADEHRQVLHSASLVPTQQAIIYSPAPTDAAKASMYGHCDGGIIFMHQLETAMELRPLSIPDVIQVFPRVHGDERGFFFEAWNQREFAARGLPTSFVQLNHSTSTQGILRGLHFQYHNPQGKLVRVLQGRVFDVAVDLRPTSACFGSWTSVELSAADHSLLWVPEGFAHGFCVLSETADFEYLCTRYYNPQDEGVIHWADPDLCITWPVETPQLSVKDAAAPSFAEVRNRLLAR